MMKKLLVSVASKYIHSALAVWYLKAEVPQYDVFECTINEDIDAVYKRIIEEKPEIIGFSCYIWNISYIHRLTLMVKRALPEIKIIYGGPEVSYNPHKHLSYADCIVCGCGEKAIKEITNRLENAMEIDKIYYGEWGTIPKSPYTEEYFKALKGRIAYIETSRGCPFSCGFCLSGQKEKPVFFPLERAYEDILRLSQADVKTIKFVDRTFNALDDRACELWSFMLNDERLNKDICYHFEIGADLLSERQLKLLSTAKKGRFQLEIGLQSFNDSTLNAVNRKTSVDKSVDNICLLVDNSNMHIHTDLIIGLPVEDFESFKGSFNKAYSLNANMLQVGFLKLLHGSRLMEDAGKYGIIFNKEPPYEVISTNWISEKEIEELHAFEDIVERMHNSGRFLRTIDFLLKATKKSPFDLFFDISRGIKYDVGCSLDEFTKELFEYFKPLGAYLRDSLVLDRLESNNTGVLPQSLKIYDENLKKVRQYIKEKYPPKKGVLRGTAILYGCGKAAFCDYETYDKVTGRYEARLTEYEL